MLFVLKLLLSRNHRYLDTTSCLASHEAGPYVPGTMVVEAGHTVIAGETMLSAGGSEHVTGS